MDKEVAEIKGEHFEALKGRDLIIIAKSDYGYEVHQWWPNGVAPTSQYDNAQEAAARALQLLNIKEPVNPQSWPEKAVISFSDKS